MAKFQLLEARQYLSQALENYLRDCGINTNSSDAYEYEFNAIIDFASAYLLGTVLSLDGINVKSILDYFTFKIRKNVLNSLSELKKETFH